MNNLLSENQNAYSYNFTVSLLLNSNRIIKKIKLTTYLFSPKSIKCIGLYVLSAE